MSLNALLWFSSQRHLVFLRSSSNKDSTVVEYSGVNLTCQAKKCSDVLGFTLSWKPVTDWIFSDSVVICSAEIMCLNLMLGFPNSHFSSLSTKLACCSTSNAIFMCLRCSSNDLDFTRLSSTNILTNSSTSGPSANSRHLTNNHSC